MSDTPDIVRITNREIYDLVQQLDRRVASVEHIVGTVLKDNSDKAGRIRSLELRYYGILASVTATLAGLGVGVWFA